MMKPCTHMQRANSYIQHVDRLLAVCYVSHRVHRSYTCRLFDDFFLSRSCARIRCIQCALEKRATVMIGIENRKDSMSQRKRKASPFFSYSFSLIFVH